MMNMATGGHDVVGQIVVSADGQTMTSTGTVTLGGSQGNGAGRRLGSRNHPRYAIPRPTIA